MKKFVKVSTISLLMVLTSFLFSACGEPSPKEFSCDAGLTITVTNNFYEKDHVSFTMYLESSSSLFVAQKETFDSLRAVNINENSTLKEYAEKVISLNGLSNVSPQVDEENNLTYFDYEKSNSGKDFHYFATVVKGSDAFWLCQFACETKNTDSLRPNFITWAKTITVI